MVMSRRGSNETPTPRDIAGHRAAGEIRPNKGNVEPRTLFRSISPRRRQRLRSIRARNEGPDSRTNGDANGTSILEIFEFLAVT